MATTAAEREKMGRERSMVLIRTMAAPHRVLDWYVIDPGDDPWAVFCDVCEAGSFQQVRRRDGVDAEGMLVTITEPPHCIDLNMAVDLLVEEINRVAQERVQVGFGYVRTPTFEVA